MPNPFSSATKSKVRLPLIIALAAIAVLAFGLWLWWDRIFISPHQVFKGMLSNSLSVSSVTRRVQQDNVFQGRQDEIAQLVFGPQNAVHVISTVVQRDTNGQENRVVTESIGTLSDDFARYVNIKTAQKGESGKELDFSKIQNVWARSDQPQSGQFTNARYFRQSLQGIVLFGNLPPAERAKLVDRIMREEIYKTDFSKAELKFENGRQRYIYEVFIQPDKYVGLLNAYNEIIGLGGESNVDPEAYKNTPPVSLKLTVDVLSRQLVQITYANDEQTGRRETYSGHNGRYPLALPGQTISFSELQKRVEEVR